MRRSRRGGGFHQEFGGSGEDSFVAVVVTKLTGALLFILLLTMVIMALIPKADMAGQVAQSEKSEKASKLALDVPETLPEAFLGRPYQFSFSARGDSAGPLVWSVREALPPGLSFDEKKGRLEGTVADPKLEKIELTIQATDGKTVAGAVTTLPVWNPDAKSGDASVLEQQAAFAGMPMQAWVSQGFGLALIWFGYFGGVGVIDRMESLSMAGSNGSDTRPGRFRLYRIVTALFCLACTGLISAMVWA